MQKNRPTRNLALELVRVTEAAALAAGRWMGRGNKNEADKAAVDAMRLVLNTIEMKGHVVICEGTKDKAPMLACGEVFGTGDQPELDIAIDPIDGTRPLSCGLWNSISTVALAPRGTLFNPGPLVYMQKIAVGPAARHVIDINASVGENLVRIAKAKGEKIEDLTVIILDRPRHEDLVSEVRECGARIRLIPDGDVAAAIMTAWKESHIDVLMGIGGAPEGIISAIALRCMGGNIQCKPYPRNDEERKKAIEQGIDPDKVLTMDDLVSSDDVFISVTGLTRGDLLEGVNYYKDGAQTDSLVMRGQTGTIRHIIADHSLKKLDTISQIQY